MIKTKLPWMKCIPLALLNIQTMPHAETGLSPYEMIYGIPYSQGISLDNTLIEDYSIQYIITIGKNLEES